MMFYGLENPFRTNWIFFCRKNAVGKAILQQDKKVEGGGVFTGAHNDYIMKIFVMRLWFSSLPYNDST